MPTLQFRDARCRGPAERPTSNALGKGGCVVPAVLIGESNADLGWVLSLLFRRADYRATAVATAALLLDAARLSIPDLVLVNLHDQQGLDVCRALRADPRTAHTPIIVLSPAPYPDADAAARAGADDFVSMPFGNTDLLRRSDALLRRADRGLLHMP